MDPGRIKPRDVMIGMVVFYLWIIAITIKQCF